MNIRQFLRLPGTPNQSLPGLKDDFAKRAAQAARTSCHKPNIEHNNSGID
ncbi:MAG TPA: hypothetical protein VKC60_08155 [Opitutaceae bacterium]|nr:hypothetical protein [Opitutaceae bacterium]